jgi:predicted MPP superfamily phosphohydrolase
VAGVTGAAAAFTIFGAFAGLAIGLASPARTEIAGGTAEIRVHLGRSYDLLQFGGVLTGKLDTSRNLLGESIAVTVAINPESATFVTSDGKIDPTLLPAYIQTYSDPSELAKSLRSVLVSHLVRFAVGGGVVALAIAAIAAGLVRWRRRRDTRDPAAAQQRAAALAYRSPERALARHVAVALVALSVLASVPSAVSHPRHHADLLPTPLLADTPLAGAEVGGPLASAFTAAATYIQRYFAQTDDYYNTVRDNLEQTLDVSDITVPTDPNIVSFGYVTDRHCNTGMDRVIVEFLKHFDAKVLVSGGDDDFSGTFPFESACTQNLASATRRAGVTDVFVGGNHDSEATASDERNQHIKVLDGKIVRADGLSFAGLPDPRTSRYGQGIEPSSARAQEELVTEQGVNTGLIACASTGPVIVVLHDPLAGETALERGCGKATLALDGHTHRQDGPTPFLLPTGIFGQRFVGASAGGAPVSGVNDRSLTDAITVGPLNHQATIYLVSVDRTTGALVAVTECQVTPDQFVTLTQQTVSG